MPNLICTHELRIEWEDLRKWEHREWRPQPRTPGVHLSSVIRGILSRIGDLKQEDRTDEMPLVMAMGLAFENWLAGLDDYAGVAWQPGEWSKQIEGFGPLYGTPDGLSSQLHLEHGEILDVPVLEEFKYTLKSEYTQGRDRILNQKIWIWQLAANCVGAGEYFGLDLRHARLTVYWACGDYRPPKPKLLQYLIRFSREELQAFWKNVIVPGVKHASQDPGR